MTITVNPINDPPAANGTIADQSNGDADSGVNVNISGNFTDVDGDTLRYSANGLPPGLSIDPNTGVISGTIDHSASQGGPNSNGEYTVTVTATDGDGAAVNRTFTWAVTNPDPVANDDAASGGEDTVIAGNVLGGAGRGTGDVADGDPDGDTLNVTGFEVNGSTYAAGTTVNLAEGELTLNANGSYTFTPAADWGGTVPTVTYTISDGEGGTDTATLTITVDPVNDAPVTNGTIADQSNADADSITGVDVSGNFTDVDGDTLSYSASGLPAGLSIDPDTGVISGTIDHSASQGGTGGVYSVSITATDPDGESVTQTFTWAVTNPAPTANDDAVTTAEDTPVSGNVITAVATGDVADSDQDGDALSVTGFEVNGANYAAGTTVNLAEGDLTLNTDGSYTFTPTADWGGTVPTVTYTISDGEGGTATAVLNITVTAVNDAPVTIGTIADQNNVDAQSIATLDVTAYFNDIDSLTLTYSADGLPPGLSIDPNTGVISGTIDHSASQGGPDSNGEYTVTVTATDGDGAAVDQTFTWTVTNPDPMANDDTASGDEDTVITGNVLGGTGAGTGDVTDSDQDGDTLSVTTFTVAGDATVHNADGSAVTIAGVGTFTLDSDGSYTLTPDADWNGTVPTMTYTISDGEGGTDTATLTITFDPVNDAPVILENAQSDEVIEAGNLDDGTVVAGTPSATGSFTATDADAGATQTWSVVGTPDTTYGMFAVDASGNWTYTLDNTLAATQALNEGDSIPLTYTVRVTDEHGEYAEQTVTITVTGTNDSPAATADVDAVTETGVENGGNTPTAGTASATGNVLSNDTDLDDGETATLQVSEVSYDGTTGTVGAALTGTYGSLVLNANGTYTYTLDNADTGTQALKHGATATEVFTYTAIDVNDATSTSTLTITITGTNDQPVITSDASAAQGSVTEQGTANPADTPTVSGTLTAADVDTDATQTWAIEGTGTDGTYGTISIDPAAGQWTYTLDNTRAATQALNDGDVKTETFTARVTDEFGAYSEQTITITVTGSNDDLTGTGAETVILTEDGSATGTLQDYVSDVDDVIVLTSFTVDADGDGNVETYTLGTNHTPGSNLALTDGDGNPLGTLTFATNGSYTFTPAANYAGDVPTVTYTMAESGGGSATLTQTLSFEITKVADAPDMAADKIVNTTEDTAVSLGLTKPTTTDIGTGTGNDDRPERLGAITLTISGDGASGVTLATGGTPLSFVSNTITIVLTDEPHVTSVPLVDNANGIYYLTTAQYEALMAHPSPESGDNFTITVSATSYEVNDTGAIISGVDGATSTQTINVDVLAVTDGATLALDSGVTAADLTFAEDTTIDLSPYLTATLASPDANLGNDTDGSETYWYSVGGLPDGTVVNINGTDYTAGATGTVTSEAGDTFTALPTITVKPPADFSGDINGITITLHSLDTDDDSTGTIDPVISSVALDLHVTPVAGDVGANDVDTAEDTAAAFLAGVAVTDTGAGSEVIDSVSFEVPTNWMVTAPAASAGWTSSLVGTTYTITFDGTLTEADREAILDAFTIKSPAHSSADTTITLSIATTDTNTVNGSPASNTQTVNRDVTVTVTPVAERTDSDTNGAPGNDVTMHGDETYSVAGKEDAWFALGTTYTGAANTSGGYTLASDWSNEDTDEFTYAVFTPSLSSIEPSDTVIGTQFRYSTDGGTTWEVRTYVGEAIWVPAQYLNTLQVKLPADVSGTLTIGVQAGTVDYDDDTATEILTLPLDPPTTSGPGVSVNVTGSATLAMIEIAPVADAVTMALNGRASGLEDTGIALAIKTTSSDASETFNVTISGIPNGATLTYGGVELTVSGGSVTIATFSNTTPLTITPPTDSNDDFQLTVSAVSVDGADTSAQVTRTIDVSVTGVADEAVVTLPATSYGTSEAALDSGDHKVALCNLVTSVATPDAVDGSEAVTLRITGLAEGFSVSGATMVTSGTGTERAWVVSAGNLSAVAIVVPNNFSGTATFQVAGVTTENDGDSLTGGLIPVSFTVTPSPEAAITTSATLVEDEVTLLNLAVVHQNGDTNETLGAVYVPVGHDTSTYTLYLGNTVLSAALTPQTINGLAGVPDGDYYVIPAGQVSTLGAQGAPDLDGSLGSLNFWYQVTDAPVDGTLPAVTTIQSGTLALTATPVTDNVDASITAITTSAGTTSDLTLGDDATPDTATMTSGGLVTVNLHVASTDTDGSEHLIRVLIDGVPDGVTVLGAAQVDTDSWLLVYDGEGAQPIGVGGTDVPVQFIVSAGAGNGSFPITMMVQAQDQGQSATSTAAIETDSVDWNLVLNLGPGTGDAPPNIYEWSYNGAAGTEDTAFTLASVIDAQVSTPSASVDYIYTVIVTDLPAGSAVSGMTLTTIGGVPTWTATVLVAAGSDNQTALQNLLSGINITAPQNSNDNNTDFSFNARLTAAAVGGASVQADTGTDMPIIPVTDEASVTVTTSDVGEGAGSVTATITAHDTADGSYGQIVDGKLYVQVTNSNNGGGAVTDGGGNTLSLVHVGADEVDGVPEGDYYIIDVGAAGGSVDLTYTAASGATLQPGDVTFTAWALTQETSASNVMSASASGMAEIVIVNNGVTVDGNVGWTGNEPDEADKSKAIELSGLDVALNDNDGSESILSTLLSNVPVGFLVYVGADAGSATLASNAGGDGTTNTWVLSTDDALPPYVAILPATHWSGTLSGLALVVESGENSLSTTLVETIDLADVVVNAVADGITIDPTVSFGIENHVIDLNLNASMTDPLAAMAAAPDSSTETTTLQITGLGEHAAFYIDNTPFTSASYDEATDTYTLTSLSQDQLDKLGFVQAASAVTDQDGASGTQVSVTAWTVESVNGHESVHVTETLTVSMSAVTATTGDDSFIWNDSAINGKAGTDTVALRYSEDVTHTELAGLLRNVEVIDLSVAGANSITGGLSIADVLQITGSSSGTLTIKGNSDDTVVLSSTTEWSTTGTASGGYVTYTGTSGVTLLIDEDIHNNHHVNYAA